VGRETSTAIGPTVGSTSKPEPKEVVPQETAKQETGSDIPKNVVESILPGVKLSGSVLLFDYSPVRVAGARPSFDLYGAWLNLDRDGERLGFHVELRFRTTKFRPYYDGTSWVQEAYVKAKVPGGTIKVGRIYKQLGIFSDYSFFGDLPYFDGLKYDAEWGLSYEGDNKLSSRLSFHHDLQFFRTDGRTNGSFAGRDVVSDPTSQRRNEFVLRGVPKFQLSDGMSIAMGGTFERGTVSRTVTGGDDTYRRAASEATLVLGPATLFGEMIHQTFDGPAFANLPRVTYALGGANYKFSKRVAMHFNYSQGNYDSVDANRRKEYIIQPGIVLQLGRGISLFEENNYWTVRGQTKSIFDRSVNSVLIFSF
jgi:hypothetical protein